MRGCGHYVAQLVGYLEHAAPVTYPLGLERRRYGEADGLLGARGVSDHQARGHGVEVTLDALHARIEALEVDAEIISISLGLHSPYEQGYHKAAVVDHLVRHNKKVSHNRLEVPKAPQGHKGAPHRRLRLTRPEFAPNPRAPQPPQGGDPEKPETIPRAGRQAPACPWTRRPGKAKGRRGGPNMPPGGQVAVNNYAVLVNEGAPCSTKVGRRSG